MIAVDLLVPVKPLHLAKTRLRGDRPEPRHRDLAMALARDTIAAATEASLVRRVVAICSDPDAVAVLRADGTEIIPDEPDAGLNPALRHGAGLLGGAGTAVGALQSDLAALRAIELDAALERFLAGGAGRAFCRDRDGTGTTLLVALGVDLDPRFGHGSAQAHHASGARELTGPWPTLRCDVDTPADLTAAAALGLGPHTRAALAEVG